MKAFIAIIALLAASLAQAHSGGTDTQGCHMGHKTGAITAIDPLR